MLAVLGIVLSVGSIAGTQQRPTIEISVAARSVQPGEVVRLDIRCSCQDEAPSATVFGRDVPLFSVGAEGGWRGLIGIDLETTPGPYPIAVTMGRDGHVEATRTLEVAAKQFTVRRLRVAGRFVDPPESAQARIAREAEILDSLFAASTVRVWDLPFRLPVTQAPISNFGTRSVFNGKPRSPHGGVDFASPTGTPIAAPSAGHVALAMPLYFTGNTVIIDHGQGIYSLFAHLSKFSVQQGALVARGDVVGLVGATGRVTGPHLHWTVRLHGARVDPLSLIAATDKHEDHEGHEGQIRFR
jgi:murein DD-endopeptidase MepM/ murein hydrolase activator NlpD